MNTNPDAYTILCFGDSNTYGAPAEDDGLDRIPADSRWTGRLQDRLGPAYRVIEEGLNGRTTDLDEAGWPGRNGRTYLKPCLESHHPVDLVLLMLGSNDIKTEFGRTADDVARALGGLLDDIARYAPRAGVLLVSPVPMDDTRPLYAEWTAPEFGPAALDESRRFAVTIGDLARGRGVRYADAGSVAEPGDDGLHLGRAAHGRLADLFAGIVAEAAAR